MTRSNFHHIRDAATVVKPGATLEQLEHSLEIQLDDIRLRLGKSKLNGAEPALNNLSEFRGPPQLELGSFQGTDN